MVELEPYFCFGSESVPMDKLDGLQLLDFVSLFNFLYKPCNWQDAGAYNIRVVSTCVQSYVRPDMILKLRSSTLQLVLAPWFKPNDSGLGVKG